MTSKPKPPSLTRLAIAVEGEGLGPKDLPLTIEEIRRRKPQSSLMAALEEARRSMTLRGIVYDSTKIIAEDEDEDEGVVETERG